MPTRRLDYDDSFLRVFGAEVVRCDPVGPEGGREAYRVSARTEFASGSGSVACS